MFSSSHASSLPADPSGTLPPIVPDHRLVRPIGRGSYGEVWLAQSLLGTWRAVKIIYSDPQASSPGVDREFQGIQRFEPVSRGCSSLVHVLQVGKDPAGKFLYCIMELADDAALDEPWQHGHQQSVAGIVNPDTYLPKTLSLEKRRRGRLPPRHCLEIALRLAEALRHLHCNDLLHRDIKPSNIIFVGNTPKLADIGLVAAMNNARSYVGTEGYIPPEGPNSPEADIFSLGKVLYEISTGKDRQDFPEPLTLLPEAQDSALLAEFNAVVLKACHPDLRRRYRSAAALLDDLLLLNSGSSVRLKRARSRRLRNWSLVGAAAGAAALASLFLESRIEHRISAFQRTSDSGSTSFNGSIPERPLSASSRFIDLSPHYNASLLEAWHPGPADNTLRELPSGLVDLAGTQFDVRGLLQLSGTELHRYAGDRYPTNSRAIRLASWVDSLHFLHGAVSEAPEGTQIGTYHIRYVGGRKLDLPIHYGLNVRAVWQPDDTLGTLDQASIAWEGANPAVRERGLKLRLYKFSWKNPHPEQEIEAVHFHSSMRNAAPFLVALTADEAPPPPAPATTRAQLRAALQQHAPAFPDFPRSEKLQEYRYSHAPLQIGDHFYYAWRLRTPAAPGHDLLWAISFPADSPEFQWYILPVTGAMKSGFEDWWHLDEQASTNRQLRVQHLSGKKLQPDTEYLLWLSSHQPTFPTVELQLKFVPGGTANPNKPAELFKALQLGHDLESTPAHRHYCLGAMQ